MSVTNAISGLTAVGGLILLKKADGPLSVILAASGTAVSAVNIFGGFVVSQRMLNLFKRPGDEDHSHFYLVPGALFIVLSLFIHKDINAIQVLCGLLCIISIGGLSSMKTSNMGCKLGISAVGAALVSTLVHLFLSSGPLILLVAIVLVALGG